MPENLKVFRKKSKVKTWFNELAREVLTGEDLPVREPSVATGNTVAIFQEYPSLPSDDSGSELEMEGPSQTAIKGMAEIRQQFQLLQAQLTETKEKLANIEQKDKEKSFAQTSQETQDHVGRVVAILECPKAEDSQEVYVSFLKAEKAAGRGDRLTLRELNRVDAEYKKRLLDFSYKVPTYDGNAGKVFDWCGKLEKHLSRFECETIPNDAIKRMLLDCITGKA